VSSNLKHVQVNQDTKPTGEGKIIYNNRKAEYCSNQAAHIEAQSVEWVDYRIYTTSKP